MPERSSKANPPRDINRLAARIVGAATDGEPEPDDTGEETSATDKNPHAAALGRIGGKKGGPARAMKLSAERRSEIARKAAQARWHGADDDGAERGG